MSGSEPESAEAVLTENDKILAVGSLEAVQAAAESGKHQDTPILKDLKGAVMLPAFIDSHSHITAVARVLSFAVLQEAESFDGIIGILNRFKEERKLEPGDWIIGTGYDHNNLKEGRHPDRFILDAAFPENPVMVTHASGHMASPIPCAWKKWGITGEHQRSFRRPDWPCGRQKYRRAGRLSGRDSFYRCILGNTGTGNGTAWQTASGS